MGRWVSGEGGEVMDRKEWEKVEAGGFGGVGRGGSGREEEAVAVEEG